MATTEDDITRYVEKVISSTEDIFKNKVVDLTRRGGRLPFRFGFYEIRKLLDGFLRGEKDNRWIIMPGFRGTGKTTILAQAYFYLREDKNIKAEQILFL